MTSKHVAEVAGVSQTTVSFVLNNVERANISDETKARVWQAASALGYVPDARARALAGGTSPNLALILGNAHAQAFIDEYIPKILTGINAVTRPKHVRIMVEVVEENGPSPAIHAMVRGREVAGLIVNFNNPLPGFVEQLAGFVAEGFPVVSLAHVADAIPSVMVDKLSGVRLAVQHLLRLGYQRIACITYAPIQTQRHVQERLAIFHRALSQAGQSADPALIREGDYEPETGYAAMQALLALEKRPDALFAMNDVIAVGAIKAIQDAGLRIPQDVAVIGFDDIRLAAFTKPALTTIHEPDVEHGRLAAEMLFQLIRGERLDTAHITLSTELRIRESCGAASAAGKWDRPSDQNNTLRNAQE